LYDGANLICEIDSGSGNVSVAYTWGAAGLISEHYTGTNQSYFYLYDASDNTRELLGSDGSIQAEFVYSSFGETQQDTAPNGQSAISTPFSWKGRSGAYRDWESDWYLIGARYYSPQMGRFISQDLMHYVVAHGHRPPDAFIDAVMQSAAEASGVDVA
jgi:RHS repeat-associated protein